MVVKRLDVPYFRDTSDGQLQVIVKLVQFEHGIGAFPIEECYLTEDIELVLRVAQHFAQTGQTLPEVEWQSWPGIWVVA